MKNAKREITLNERDSLADMREIEKTLAKAYLEAAFFEEKKALREALFEGAKNSAESAVLLSELMKERE